MWWPRSPARLLRRTTYGVPQPATARGPVASLRGVAGDDYRIGPCRRIPKGAARIGHRVGRDANRRKAEKQFDIIITDATFTWSRRQKRIDQEDRLDGVYVIRLPGAGQQRTIIVNRRTRLQNRAFELPEVNPDRTVPINLTG